MVGLVRRSTKSSRLTAGKYVVHSYILILTNAEDAQNPAEFGFAKRHPWQSWRERYKKNSQRLDLMIADMVAADPPPADGKGLFLYSRLENNRQYHERRMKNLYRLDDDEEEEYDAEEQQENHEHQLGENVQQHLSPARPPADQRAESRHIDSGVHRLQAQHATKPSRRRRSAPVHMLQHQHEDLDDTGEFKSTVHSDDE